MIDAKQISTPRSSGGDVMPRRRFHAQEICAMEEIWIAEVRRIAEEQRIAKTPVVYTAPSSPADVGVFGSWFGITLGTVAYLAVSLAFWFAMAYGAVQG
jgi:hypothetical protein